MRLWFGGTGGEQAPLQLPVAVCMVHGRFWGGKPPGARGLVTISAAHPERIVYINTNSNSVASKTVRQLEPKLW